MQVRLKRVGAAGMKIDLDLHATWAQEAAAEAMESSLDTLTGSVDVSAPLDDGRVDVRCELAMTGPSQCERCGEVTSVAIHVDSLLLFFPAGQAPDGTGDIELNRKDLDVGWYTEGAIDLSDVVREAVALGMPPRVICADADECDVRTRKLLEKAHEGVPSGHPAFAVLRNLN
jgi:uncharacterized metal-binding protein YceD (DUF177 family)